MPVRLRSTAHDRLAALLTEQWHAVTRGSVRRGASLFILERVAGLLGGDVFFALIGVGVGDDLVDCHRVGIFGDLDKERYAPSAAGAGVETFRHSAGLLGTDPPGEVDQLPQRDVVAIADIVVEFHQEDHTLRRRESRGQAPSPPGRGLG